MRKNIIIAIIFILVGAAIGWCVKNPGTEIREKEVEVVKKDVITVIKEVVKSDGTKEIITTITDKSKENSTKDKTIKVVSIRNWKANLGVSRGFNGAQEYIYDIGVERRLFDNVWIGVKGQTGHQNFGNSVGISIGIEF